MPDDASLTASRHAPDLKITVDCSIETDAPDERGKAACTSAARSTGPAGSLTVLVRAIRSLKGTGASPFDLPAESREWSPLPPSRG